jgi:CRP/FNR family transcriptional regulator, cyclic AMP receptor protein
MNSDATGAAQHSLSGIKLFEGVPADVLRVIESKCRWLDVGADQTVVPAEEASTDVYFVLAGTVRVVNIRDDGTEVHLGELHAGDVFGELSAINSSRRSAQVIGDQACMLGALSADSFRAVLANQSKVALRLIEQLAAVVRNMNEKVTQMSTLSPRQRIYAALVKLAVPSPSGDGSWMIDTPPNHDVLASQAGTEKQDVAMAIGTLAREGILERKHKRFVVRDHPRLRMMASM